MSTPNSKRGVLLPAKSTEWETPQDLFDQLNATYAFTVDVAASDTNHKCERYYTIEQDGLQQDWRGERIWCNPPYDVKSLDAFTQKAVMATIEDRSTIAVFLVPVKTDQAWFHRCVLWGEILLIRGRLRFGSARHSAPMPVCLILLGNQFDNGVISTFTPWGK